MIVQLKNNITSAQEMQVKNEVSLSGFSLREVVTASQRYLVCIGSKPVDLRRIGCLPGVRDVHRVTDANQLVSREWRVKDTVIDMGDALHIGTGEFTLMAGPCSIESEAQIAATVQFLSQQGVRVMRGGVFKPRSSPYAFRGLGIEGLKLFSSLCHEAGIKIVSEVMQSDQIEQMQPYVDIFQVGARNAQNFTLLDALGQCGKPVLLKRGISGTAEELLSAAEYIFSNGNESIILCERGIRSYEKAYRNTLDLNIVPVLKSRTHLPVVVDPSHGIGIRRHIPQMALAAVMAGADGLLLEIHPQPEKAASDGAQTLNFEEAALLFSQLRQAVALRQSFQL
ncbi:MAG: 3-deoxy-7-phosphoheptulonate synthase [Bacteroidetes bacterium]|nr:3-deoxy-7-phosphoheptulonate synthase [Bacteroidota bacterium]